MVKLSVIYRGRPQDPAAFDSYYWTKHLPTVARWPRIRRITFSTAEPGEEIYQVCDLYFDSMDDLQSALTSAERKVSLDDVKRFPEFKGEVKRQVFELKDFKV